MLPPEATGAVVGDLAAPRNMSNALAGVQAVIHSAGLAHGMSGLPEDDYRAINTEATVALARAAARAGARRFVFLSSIRAQSGPAARDVLTEELEPRPTDAYGRSKLDAERGLADAGIDWAALRPVLVYGPGVKGNMAALLKLAQLAAPLPLGGLSGRRSLLSVENLVEAIDVVLRTDAPLRRPLIVADPDPLTIPEMVAALRAGLGRRPGLIPVPSILLRHALRLFGHAEAYERLAASLVARPDALTGLGWRPPVATRDGLAALARDAAANRGGLEPAKAAHETV
jgi:nucleoside-diphosphate-sugar epimerase